MKSIGSIPNSAEHTEHSVMVAAKVTPDTVLGKISLMLDDGDDAGGERGSLIAAVHSTAGQRLEVGKCSLFRERECGKAGD